MVFPAFPGNARTEIVRIDRPYVPDADKMFRGPLEGLIRSVKRYMTPAAQRETTIRFASVLGRQHSSWQDSKRFIDFLCSECLSQHQLDEAHRLIGAALLELYQDTLLYQTMAFALRRASIEWVLKSLPKHFETTQNFGSFQMGEVAERHWRFTLADYTPYPHLLQGYLEAGARLLRNDSKYDLTVIDAHNIYFDITWEIGRLPG